MRESLPRIACLKDGPYLLKNDETSPVALKIQHHEGETETPVSGVALCRCGSSRNKPYCDGSHKRNGFSDEKLADGSQDRRSSYPGNRITIHDNRGICAHAGVCTENLKAVFRMGEEPWIDPDAASVESIVDVVRRCPSGALGYSIDEAEFLPPHGEPRITVIKDGPYMLSCVVLADQSLGDGVTSSRYTLCRCGASKNKPFCDGSHWHVGFRDDAESGDA